MRKLHVSNSEWNMAARHWGIKVNESGVEYIPAMIKMLGHVRLYRVGR